MQELDSHAFMFAERGKNILYYHGVTDNIRWVLEFIDATSGEIDKFEPGRQMECGFWTCVQSGVGKKKSVGTGLGDFFAALGHHV